MFLTPLNFLASSTSLPKIDVNESNGAETPLQTSSIIEENGAEISLSSLEGTRAPPKSKPAFEHTPQYFLNICYVLKVLDSWDNTLNETAAPGPSSKFQPIREATPEKKIVLQEFYALSQVHEALLRRQAKSEPSYSQELGLPPSAFMKQTAENDTVNVQPTLTSPFLQPTPTISFQTNVAEGNYNENNLMGEASPWNNDDVIDLTDTLENLPCQPQTQTPAAVQNLIMDEAFRWNNDEVIDLTDTPLENLPRQPQTPAAVQNPIMGEASPWDNDEVIDLTETAENLPHQRQTQTPAAVQNLIMGEASPWENDDVIDLTDIPEDLLQPQMQAPAAVQNYSQYELSPPPHLSGYSYYTDPYTGNPVIAQTPTTNPEDDHLSLYQYDGNHAILHTNQSQIPQGLPEFIQGSSQQMVPQRYDPNMALAAYSVPPMSPFFTSQYLPDGTAALHPDAPFLYDNYLHPANDQPSTTAQKRKREETVATSPRKRHAPSASVAPLPSSSVVELPNWVNVLNSLPLIDPRRAGAPCKITPDDSDTDYSFYECQYTGPASQGANCGEIIRSKCERNFKRHVAYHANKEEKMVKAGTLQVDQVHALLWVAKSKFTCPVEGCGFYAEEWRVDGIRKRHMESIHNVKVRRVAVKDEG